MHPQPSVRNRNKHAYMLAFTHPQVLHGFNLMKSTCLWHGDDKMACCLRSLCSAHVGIYLLRKTQLKDLSVDGKKKKFLNI